MADARRSSSVAAPPSQMRGDPLVDADGFRTVVYKRRARGDTRLPRRPRRPVPADLVGRCFNCLATDHVASCCTQPSRCLRCEQVGHVARNCKRPRFPGPPRGRGCPTRRFVPAADVTAAANIRSRCHSAASASTASSGSASTGCAYSGPPSICAASPVGRSPSPEAHTWSDFPQGHPSRRPQLVTRTIPRTAELQQAEDSLATTALVVLVVGTRPS
ncbi:hypothetical protein PVAP13_1NG128738 [Panicum virgatum]|uniref:CCHC-type domain-containing protein n=1 Tax=Panicum virgatum TaxID=38727 RepID=A0A8T0WJB5_PANVG|nr:hypothetical protein PVAP13_1NG128738 [Panicum virgatum]